MFQGEFDLLEEENHPPFLTRFAFRVSTTLPQPAFNLRLSFYIILQMHAPLLQPEEARFMLPQ